MRKIKIVFIQHQLVFGGAEKRSSYFDGKRMVKEIEELFLKLVKE